MKEHYESYCPMKKKGQCDECGELMLRAEIEKHKENIHSKTNFCKCSESCMPKKISFAKCLSNRLKNQTKILENSVNEVQIKLQQVD